MKLLPPLPRRSKRPASSLFLRTVAERECGSRSGANARSRCRCASVALIDAREYQYHVGKSAGGAFRLGLLNAFEGGSKFWRLSVAIETGRVRLGTWLWSGKVRAQTQ